MWAFTVVFSAAAGPPRAGTSTVFCSPGLVMFTVAGQGALHLTTADTWWDPGSMELGSPHAVDATGKPSSETCMPAASEPGGTLMVSLGMSGPRVEMCFCASFALGSTARVCKTTVLN